MCRGEDSTLTESVQSSHFFIPIFIGTQKYVQTFRVLGREPRSWLALGLLNAVPGRGLEPPRITPRAPKARASTNFATPASTENVTYVGLLYLTTIHDFYMCAQ